MHFTCGLIVTLCAMTLASPTPAEVEVSAPNNGLARRGSSPKVNKPITDAQWEGLKAMGMTKPGDSKRSLDKRDKTLNCGWNLDKTKGNNGNGAWVPLKQFTELADEFCGAYVGTELAPSHSTSDVYPCFFSNQKDNTQRGPPGNMIFAIYNTLSEKNWIVTHDTCLRAMKGPLGDHVSKRDGVDYVQLTKRDNCYGTQNNDYEGGYYQVDSLGAFGSETQWPPGS